MFDILVYLFDNYHAPEACPDADVLARRLAAAGFEHHDIHDALTWLSGLAEATQQCADLAVVPISGVRVYAESEMQQLGPDAIGFITFLESAGVLSAPLREIVVDRAMALDDAPVPLDKLRIIVLMVLWSQEADIDTLFLAELIDDDSPRLLH